MRYVRSDKLVPGQILARPAYDEYGAVLLAANYKLTIKTIDKLQSRNMGLYVFDEFSDYEELNEIISETVRMDAVKALKTFDIDKVLYFTNEIVNSMLMQEDIILDAGALREYDEDTYQHSVNVAMLSTACAIGMGLSNEKIKHTAQAALLHDIGKQLIPLDILNKPEKLTVIEKDIMNQHPRLAYDMLFTNERIHPEVRSAILCHHENYDGSGYPCGLVGKNIPLIARILRIADTYDAMCHKRSYKNSLPVSSVVEYLMANNGTLFDLEIMESFLKYIVLYPVGTTVYLSTGEKARVIKNRAMYVGRPVVMTVEDKRLLDLALDRKCYCITILELKNENEEEEIKREKDREEYSIADRFVG